MKSFVVYTVLPVRRREENSRVDECAWHLVVADAPRVVVLCNHCLFVTVVAVEVTERTGPLLDDIDPERAIVFDVPAQFVAVVDVELPADMSGNVRLVP